MKPSQSCEGFFCSWLCFDQADFPSAERTQTTESGIDCAGLFDFERRWFITKIDWSIHSADSKYE